MTHYCVTCGKPITTKTYCCDEHEAAYQEHAARNRQRNIHDQPYGSVAPYFYDRDTGQPIAYPASKYGEAYTAPPNPHLK